MAICKIISPHLALESGAAIEDSTFTDSAQPGSNLLLPNLWALAQSDGSASQYVTFDFGSAVSVEACAVLAHTIPSSPSVLRIAGHTADSWGSPASGWIDLTYNSNEIIKFFGATHSYRYWRLEVTASASFVIGSIVLGEVWEAPHAGYNGLSRSRKLSADGTISYEALSFGLEHLTQAQSEELIAILDRHRQRRHGGPYHWSAKPTLFCLDSGSDIVDDGLQEWSFYAVVAGDPSAGMGYHTHDNYRIALEECL